MNSLSTTLHLQPFSSPSPSSLLRSTPSNFPIQRPRFPLSYSSSSTQSNSIQGEISASKTVSVYNPGPLDDLFLNLFRKKMVQETGWDSEKAGYDGLIEVANRLMLGRSSSDVSDAALGTMRLWDLAGFLFGVVDCCLVWLLDLRVPAFVLSPCDGRGLEETGRLVATGSKSEVSSLDPQDFPVCRCQEMCGSSRVRIGCACVF